jgi:hypothetical protein
VIASSIFANDYNVDEGIFLSKKKSKIIHHARLKRGQSDEKK